MNVHSVFLFEQSFSMWVFFLFFPFFFLKDSLKICYTRRKFRIGMYNLLYHSTEMGVVCCRAWVMRSSQPSDLVRVFYLDYGNTAAIPWSHTAKISDRWLWELQPMAIPFTLTGQCPGGDGVVSLD